MFNWITYDGFTKGFNEALTAFGMKESPRFATSIYFLVILGIIVLITKATFFNHSAQDVIGQKIETNCSGSVECIGLRVDVRR